MMAVLQNLPAKVDVYEVGPRDGLQNEPKILSTPDKVRLVHALIAAGEKRIEITSFVSPRWIPPLADAEKLLAQVDRPEGVIYSALVPNLTGLQRAIDAGIHEAGVFLSVTESHSKKNINKTVAEAIRTAREVSEAAAKAKLRVRAYLSCVWGCPFEGAVSIKRIIEVVQQLKNVGLYQVSLGDTIGVGTPVQTRDIIEAVSEHFSPFELAVHLHDTRGTALANALVGLSMGVTTFDASVGGLGGCPYAPGAAGNLASEDLVYMLHGMGVQTGVDLEKLVDAGELAQSLIGKKLSGKYLQAALGTREKAARAIRGTT